MTFIGYKIQYFLCYSHISYKLNVVTYFFSGLTTLQAMNNTAPIIITLPVSQSVVRNLTDDIETRWLQMILNVIKRSNLPTNSYNIAIMVFIFIVLIMVVLRYIIKHRHRFPCTMKKIEIQENLKVDELS